jgi:hypothetical protein
MPFDFVDNSETSKDSADSDATLEQDKTEDLIERYEPRDADVYLVCFSTFA